MPRQVKSPSLAQDFLMLGDVYLTLAWLAFQRLLHGSRWPWESRSSRLTAPALTLVRTEEAEGRFESATAKRG